MLSCRLLTEKLLKIKQKNLLVENELNNFKIFDSSFFREKVHYEEGGTQNGTLFITNK